MKSVLIAAAVGLIVSILVTPLAIKAFRQHGFGQEIRDDGPESHLSKKGTPTMGGTVMVLATVLGYLAAHLFLLDQEGRGVTKTGLLLLFLLIGLGTVGFLDDYLKIRYRRSLGLNKTAKLVGQLVIGVTFAVLALVEDGSGPAVATTAISFVRDIEPLVLPTFLFVAVAYLFIAGFSNAVNLTDGLDGLAAGCSAMVFASYVIISFWQFGHDCGSALATDGCYTVRDPLDVTLIAAAAMGACLGFLWWNTSPARIFMGDTGSLALGGLMSGLAIVTRTELLLVVLGGLFVAVTLSVVIQVAFFRATRRRVFRMAPLHHHFELAGWTENTVIVRFWLVTGMAVAFGIGLFYADWLSFAGL
ncbi:phospho-N-acetylmuramoyl-pentapeptide-transferase [Modestobacter versicolor]|uniref:Phospho-N-acetylmuramoyl-pentapeptide-transferase n=1 Tax=Modestobacter versicolor TaxID=429133 RepID=A0A323V346_9ACTN|nr:phospho-N-acetylmuramoyl-pentapeptide-transferase [Modestobacter versicolor]MBB3675618.1 phospho-N-acetylmuramoyl-pentapeptide-transferase [Modestobacter versicolor]PZA19207.1 phospho-N-acetylmuramoyl-pentapeptide-transferase [Modestobacter versicolor]